ncbi:MAG: two-component regulator propeller domain-containing protein [Eubacteriales bacterium]|nr:two-component regulator propeller domain-containing protein [Eubacteriales bacterium]
MNKKPSDDPDSDFADTRVVAVRKNRSVFALSLVLITAMIVVLNFVFTKTTAGASEEGTDLETVHGIAVFERSREFSVILPAGDIIFAGGNDGLFIIDRVKKEVCAHIDKISINGRDIPLSIVRALYMDSYGRLWIGHHNGLSVLLNGNDLENKTEIIDTYTIKDGLPDNRIISLSHGSDGSLWAGTFKGAAVLRNGGWSSFTIKQGLLDNNVNRILHDSCGYIWFGSYTAVDGGITLIKGGDILYFGKNEGLCHNSVTAITETEKGVIWAGGGVFTEGGATRFLYNDSCWVVDITMKKEDGFAGEKIRHIYADTKGRIWFCSEYDGISVFACEEHNNIKTMKKIAYIDEKDGISDNEIKDMAEDGEGNLWLAARRGVTLIMRAKAEQLIEEGE